jgi:uncharacterized membrane protein
MKPLRKPESTDRGLDRFMFFTDAVVAVAITLLVLPLVEMAPEMRGLSFDEALHHYLGPLASFALSFVIIGRAWVAHHQFCETITGYTHVALWLNLAWMFTIVFLPVPTELLGVSDWGQTWVNAVYMGTLLVNILIALALRAIYMRRTDLLTEAGAHVVRHSVRELVVMTAIMVVALVISLMSSAVGMWSLVLLFLSGPITAALPDRTAR